MKKTFRKHHLFHAINSFDWKGAPLDVHLGNYFRSNKAVGSKDRKYIAETIYEMVRWMGTLDHFCQGAHDWMGRLETLEQMDWEAVQKDPSLPPHVRVSFPKNLFTLLASHFGEERALEMCKVSNTPAPTTIRINPLKTTRPTLFATLKEKFTISLTSHSLFGIQIEDRSNFHLLDEFNNGHFEVQDEGSQLLSQMVEAEPGDQVLDYCAGSGGKTLAFAHRLQMKGQIYLHDIRQNALLRAKKRLKRAGIENAQLLSYDAPHKENLRGKMDWVIVDSPCSGTGTLRRNPDLKWKFTEKMLEELIQEQRKIFKEALVFLKPKGKIVYATCSLLPQENEEQMDYFQTTHSLDLVSKPFRSFPTLGGMDGFFGVVFTPSF